MIRLVVSDVDGTLTETRSGFRMPVETIKAMRRLEDSGIMVSLLSSNAFPVLAGLGRYIGLSGPLVGETGCLAFHRGEIVHLCRHSAGEAARIVEEEFSEYLKGSWQNAFRLYDYAYKLKPGVDPGRILKMVEDRLRELGYRHIYVGFSGYALHLTPLENAKAYGFKRILELAGVEKRETAAIGDSIMDAPMLLEAGLPIAVGDADEELKRIARIVTSKPAGYGFAEAAEIILREYSGSPTSSQ